MNKSTAVGNTSVYAHYQPQHKLISNIYKGDKCGGCLRFSHSVILLLYLIHNDWLTVYMILMLMNLKQQSIDVGFVRAVTVTDY